ncbi:MAG: hypothetical protein GY751_18905 [Bacteroidetes bacterium]|nr:hypothetical protein [Bacteroidota bacterium]
MYTSATEFGMKGEVNELAEGCFKMDQEGYFLEPVSQSLSGHFKARITNKSKSQQAKGLELHEDGSCFVGVEFKDDLSIIKAKEFLGVVDIDFVKQFTPMLSHTQQHLLESAYDVESILQNPHALTSYSLIISESIGVEIKDSLSFLQNANYRNIIEPVTDWITHHFSARNCHVFVGMRAMICLGKPDKELKQLLKEILVQQTFMNVYLRINATLWSKGSGLNEIAVKIPNTSYKQLKKYHQRISKINNEFSRQKILSSMMKKSINGKIADWDELMEQNPEFKDLDTGEGLHLELEKADDMNSLIDQMQVDIESIRTQLQQRISLIMTKNGQELNIILLLIALLSVLGIADVLGFDSRSTILVVLVLLPFTAYTLKAMLEFRKNYK